MSAYPAFLERSVEARDRIPQRAYELLGSLLAASAKEERHAWGGRGCGDGEAEGEADGWRGICCGRGVRGVVEYAEDGMQRMGRVCRGVEYAVYAEDGVE